MHWTQLAWLAQSPTGDKTGGIPPQLIMMFAVIVGLFYFMIIRPQKREQKKRENVLDSLGKGDAIVTIGGIHGTIESVEKDTGVVHVNVAPKVNLAFNRASISTVVRKKGAPKDDAGAKA